MSRRHSNMSSARNSVVSLSTSTGSGGSTAARKIETKLLDDEGVVLPSSSSKDDNNDDDDEEDEEDILSDSSNEVEKVALETLKNLPDDVSPDQNGSDVSGGVGSISGSTTVLLPNGDINGKKGNVVIVEDKDDPNYNFGCCGCFLMFVSYLIVILTMPFSICVCVKFVHDYERIVIFRLGKMKSGGANGPGFFFVIPCLDKYERVDLRVISFEVPPQEILSKDSVTVAVDAIVYYRVLDATMSVTSVEDSLHSTKLLAQSTLRNILGTKTLAEMLSEREPTAAQIKEALDVGTRTWGVCAERIEVKDVRLPVQLQRAMAAEAEAAREARAKVIVAEGEHKASKALKEAAEVIDRDPNAMHLRFMQTLNNIGQEKNETIIFPVPLDVMDMIFGYTLPRNVPAAAT